MAKMFYSLQEAAQQLNVSEDRIKEMADSGELQPFRDGTQLMFKRDQIDALANGGADDSEGSIGLADDTGGGTAMGGSSIGPISLADTGEADAIDLSAETRAGQTAGDTSGTQAGESAAGLSGTGMNVFDAGEVEPADSMAQTQVTRAVEDDDLALESVGSGSGLLDLTRESDDTSLGAELLDEIYPGGDASDSKMGSAVGSSGVFESALGMETGQSAPSGLDHLESTGGTPVVAEPGPTIAAGTYTESIDPAWSGASAGMLMAALVALILGLIVMASAIAGVSGGIAETLADFNPLILLAALLVLAAILGGIGFVVGKAAR